MKIFRCFICFCAIALLFSAYAETTDNSVSLMEGGLVFEQNGVSLYFNPDGYHVDHTYFMDGEGEVLSIDGYIDNQSDKDIFLQISKSSINDWIVNTWGGADLVPAGKKLKIECNFVLTDADITTIDEIDSFEVQFRVSDYNEYETIFETNNITIVK